MAVAELDVDTRDPVALGLAHRALAQTHDAELAYPQGAGVAAPSAVVGVGAQVGTRGGRAPILVRRAVVGALPGAAELRTETGGGVAATAVIPILGEVHAAGVATPGEASRADAATIRTDRRRV